MRGGTLKRWQVCRALREAGESERQAGSWKAAAEPGRQTRVLAQGATQGAGLPESRWNLEA